MASSGGAALVQAAEGTSGGGGAALTQVLFFAVLIVGFYLLAIRPQRNRAKALAEVRSSLSEGDRVITTAGIHATVVGLEGDIVVLEVSPGVHVRFVSAAIVRVLRDETGGDSAEPSDDGSADDAGDAAR